LTLANDQRRQDFGKTLRGKVYNVLGYVFAAYCAARLVMVSLLTHPC
jgi:hypothetical protein